MDLLLALLCLAVAFLSAIIIYFILVSSMKEKTYDEVKAEQKKKADEYFAQGRTVKDKAKDKKLKKAGKKVKEKASVEQSELSSEETDSKKGNVSFIESPVVEKPLVPQPQKLNTAQQVKLQAKPKEKNEKLHQQKSTSEKLNGTQKNSEKPNATKPADKSPVNVPKVLEKPVSIALTDKQLEEKKPENLEKYVKSTGKPVQAAPVIGGGDQPNASPSTKSNKKKRSEIATLQQMSGDRDGVNVNLLMPLVHKAELSRSEIQVLIDVLLNKQQGSLVENAEWIEGRQDPVVKLKKQLTEKEKALLEEQEAGVGLQNKLKELRTELNSEKHLGRQLEETLQLRQAEVTGLTSRLQQSAEEKQALGQQIQQLQAKLSEEHLLLCKLQEDQGQAQGVLQQELLNQRQQLEMHIARLTEQHQETLTALEAQIGQLASQLQEKDSLNTSLNGELSLLREHGAHLQDSAAHSQDLSRQLKELQSQLEHVVTKAQYDTGHLQSEINSLNEQLSLKRIENEKLNSTVQNLQTETNRLKDSNESLNQKVSSAYAEARQLRDEKETLSTQIASMERPAIEGRENGDVTYPENRNYLNKQDLFQEKEKLLEQMNSELALKENSVEKLTSEINNYKSTVKSLYDEIDRFNLSKEKLISEINEHKTEKAMSETLINSLRGDLDKYKLEVSQLRSKVEAAESLPRDENKEEKLLSEIRSLTNTLREKELLIAGLNKDIEKYIAKVSHLSSDFATKETQIKRLELEVKSLQEARNSISEELRTQRSKNDEAADTAKKAEQSATRQFLQREFPAIDVDVKKSHAEWLEYFANTIKTQLELQVNKESQSNDEVLAELEKQNSQLQAMVSNYKIIISDTEGMLNRLQNHVEEEESHWGQQIQALEAQLKAVMLERDRLEENSELAAKLETTLSVNKEQSKEIARLKSLVQIGQDTYDEEHKQLLFLQQEVASGKAAEGHLTSNGLTSVDVGSEVN